MKRYRQLVTVGIVAILLFASCATGGSRRVEHRPIQLMGGPNAMVISVDAEREAQLLEAVLGDMGSLADRISRVSIAMTPHSDAYPISLEDAQLWAVIEGDFPRFLVNSALIYVPGFKRQEASDGRTYFTQKDGNLSVRAVGNNSLIVTTGDYEEAYRSYRSRDPLIDEEIATLMESSSIALWAEEPKTFFELGLELPQEIFLQADSVLFLLDHDEADQYWVDAYITMKGAKEANTLSQMVRSGYVARLRREKQTVNIAALREMFLLDDLQVIIRQMELQDQELAQLKESLVGIL
ncbi:MAG: hypothetical protein WC233_06560 [Sphaerochaeta sp.]|jgi:hypothetical protein|nr:hypothetical protein [Spirochaetales bacterium]